MSDLNFLFVIPLGIGLIAAYIANQSNDDLSYLAIVIAIISFIVSLALAPWEVLLLLVALLLFSAKRLEGQRTSNAQSEDASVDLNAQTSSLSFTPKTNQKSLWKYRGVSYDISSTSEPQEPIEIGGTYRGQPWKTENSQAREKAVFSPSDLQYRGVRWTSKSSQTSSDRLQTSD